MGDLSRFGLRHRTEVAHDRLLAVVREYADGMSGLEDGCTAEVAVFQARCLVTLSQQLKMMAVLKARLVHEDSWEVVADHLGTDELTARKVYEEAEARWLDGDVEPWLPKQEDAVVRPLLRRILGGRRAP